MCEKTYASGVQKEVLCPTDSENFTYFKYYRLSTEINTSACKCACTIVLNIDEKCGKQPLTYFDSEVIQLQWCVTIAPMCTNDKRLYVGNIDPVSTHKVAKIGGRAMRLLELAQCAGSGAMMVVLSTRILLRMSYIFCSCQSIF